MRGMEENNLKIIVISERKFSIVWFRCRDRDK